jgi:hypothetical protein
MTAADTAQVYHVSFDTDTLIMPSILHREGQRKRRTREALEGCYPRLHPIHPTNAIHKISLIFLSESLPGMEHEPGALPEDAGATLADEEEDKEAPEFDGDWQRALRQSWEFASILQVQPLPCILSPGCLTEASEAHTCSIACMLTPGFVLQFCRLFSGPLKLRPFSGDQLEGALQVQSCDLPAKGTWSYL